MNGISTALACVGLICAALPAISQPKLDDATAVQVPAGPLDDAVESLAKQTRVSVIYPGDLLDGRTTSGLSAMLSPKEAFGRLLEGTSLVLAEERGSMRIAKAASALPQNSAIRTSAGAESVGSECHRVLEGSMIQRYCGSADQWTDLQARVGFRCKTLPGQDELCASSKEWKRLANTRIKWLTNENKDERSLVTDVLADTQSTTPWECRRTIQGIGQVIRYCGTAEQWNDLEVRGGYSCRTQQTRDPLCGSPSQWKRWDLARSTQRVTESHFRNDEATQSAAQNHPTPILPTFGAPAVMPMNTTPAK